MLERCEEIDWLIKKSGLMFPARVIATPIVKDMEFFGTVIAFNDIIQQYYAEQKLKEINEVLTNQAHTDPLTKLYNRRFFEERGNEIFFQSKNLNANVSVIAFDIDFFKHINDLHGHDCGDRVLEELAFLTSKQLRSNDIIARVGGEEFTVLLPNADLEQALEVAKRIKDKIALLQININSLVISCTVSLGVVSMDSNISSFTELLKIADLKLYKAKGNGRNRIEF
jgi:diguanylate cyclase (GGDEF)-like protein